MILFKKKMIREISIKTKFGWISASEVKGKICKVKCWPPKVKVMICLRF